MENRISQSQRKGRLVMQLNQNIRIAPALAERIRAEQLNSVDLFRLSAAESLSKSFEIPTYLIAQQQTKPIMQAPPALFVQVFDLQRAKLLNDERRWNLGVNVAYVSKEPDAEEEQLDAAVQIMNMMESIPPIVGEYPYRMYNVKTQRIDGIVNITGTLSVCELTLDTSPLIQIADTNVYIKE